MISSKIFLLWPCLCIFFPKYLIQIFIFINMHGFLYLQVLTISCDISGKNTVVTWLKHKHVGFFRKVWRIWPLRAIWVACSFQETIVSSKLFSKIFLMAHKVKKTTTKTFCISQTICIIQLLRYIKKMIILSTWFVILGFDV